MTGADFVVLLPLLTLAAGTLLGLVVLTTVRRSWAVLAVAVTALGLSFVTALTTGGPAAAPVAGLLSFEPFVRFILALLDAATIVVALSARSYLGGRSEEHGEYYLFLLLGTLGAGVLVCSRTFATLFLGLEVLSMALLPLIAWHRDRPAGAAAAIRYLVLSGASSAFLLFGMAMVYAATGTLEFGDPAAAGRGAAGGAILGPAGFALMVVGVGFKLAVVPFHFWTPDVFEGAPAPSAGYIATVSKGAVLALLARWYVPAVLGRPGVFLWVFGTIAAATMLVGNLLALGERNVKRMLAGSSIAHLGYLVLAFTAGGRPAAGAIAFYLLAYFSMTLGAFAVIAELSVGRERDADRLEDFRGLAGRRPWLAGALVVMLVSLTGLPLTAGFVGKFVILAAAEGAALWVLAGLLAVNATISLAYYFRVVAEVFHPAPIAPEPAGGPGAAGGTMFGSPAASTAGPRRTSVAVATGLCLAILTLLVIALGVYPSPVLEIIARLFSGQG